MYNFFLHYRMAAQFQASMDSLQAIGFTPKDMDEIKSIFADTNVYLLALTLFVASMHVSKYKIVTYSIHNNVLNDRLIDLVVVI